MPTTPYPAIFGLIAGATFSWMSPVSGGSGAPFVLTGSSGLASPIVASGTATATYVTQTFGIDANCEGFGSVASGTIITTSSMTAQANELIIVVITANYNTGATATISDSFATHLSYNLRTSTGVTGEKIYEYYAFTDSAHTGSFSITVTMSTTHTYSVQAFGITGANIANPFDTHAGVPYTNSNTGASVPTVTGVSTSNANDMILGLRRASKQHSRNSGNRVYSTPGFA